MNFDTLGAHFNDRSRENLLASLSHTQGDNKLLVTSREISKFIDFLTPFLVLKKKGKFDKSLFMDDFLTEEKLSPIDLRHRSLILIVSGDDIGVQQVKKLWALLGHKKHKKVNIVVKNLTESFLRRFSSSIFPAYTVNSLTQNSILDSVAIDLSPNCKVFPWAVYPVLTHGNVFLLKMKNGGLSDYLDNPIKVVFGLCESLIDILSETIGCRDMIKFKNVFAKGDHSSLFLKYLLNEKLPNFVSSKLSFSEQEFYSEKLAGNTDLIVLERNLDYFPLLLSHMNYMGLLDETVGTDDEINDILTTREKLDDGLFQSLKHLNFSSIGSKLNTLAKYIQLELEHSDNLSDLSEIKKLVKNLGSLTSMQDTVRKHTFLSETVLRCIKRDVKSDYKYNIRELWLELENEVFEMDYKHQLNRFYLMMDQCVSFEIVMSLLVTISLVNDGLHQGDMHNVRSLLQSNFGLRGPLSLRRLLDYNMIKVNTKANDFFGSFTFSKTKIETTTASTSIVKPGSLLRPSEEIGYDDVATVGISSGQDVYRSTYTLISKFWNLHPSEEGDMDASAVKNVTDYSQPSFTLPSSTVPLTTRFVEALYSRHFLKYRPVVKILKRPSWYNLNLDTMFRGQTIDKNLCDGLDDRTIMNQTSIREHYVIVVLLGGITRSEISVFQYLQSKLDRKVIVLTTGIVSNKSLWQAIEVQ